MPSLIERRKMLEGHAEILKHPRPRGFLIEDLEPEKRSYKSNSLEGAYNLETAAAGTLDVFLSLSERRSAKNKEDTLQDHRRDQLKIEVTYNERHKAWRL